MLAPLPAYLLKEEGWKCDEQLGWGVEVAFFAASFGSNRLAMTWQ
jgi:hypothetical protein